MVLGVPAWMMLQLSFSLFSQLPFLPGSFYQLSYWISYQIVPFEKPGPLSSFMSMTAIKDFLIQNAEIDCVTNYMWPCMLNDSCKPLFICLPMHNSLVGVCCYAMLLKERALFPLTYTQYSNMIYPFPKGRYFGSLPCCMANHTLLW